MFPDPLPDQQSRWTTLFPQRTELANQAAKPYLQSSFRHLPGKAGQVRATGYVLPAVEARKNSTLVLSCDAQAKRLHANPVQLVKRRSKLSPEHFFANLPKYNVRLKCTSMCFIYFNLLHCSLMAGLVLVVSCASLSHLLLR